MFNFLTGSSSATETCPYLSFSRLDEAADKAHSDSPLVSNMCLSYWRLI